MPPEFTWRDYTIFLLTIAAQIEHSLMVQYLYAAYSLGGSQTPEDQRGRVAAWRQVILGIAKEEMGHLATVQNVLKFLGAPLALDREDYPWDSQLAPYPFILERLTRASLAKYIVAESPETWPADVTDAERMEIENLASGYGETRSTALATYLQPSARSLATRSGCRTRCSIPRPIRCRHRGTNGAAVTARARAVPRLPARTRPQMC